MSFLLGNAFLKAEAQGKTTPRGQRDIAPFALVSLARNSPGRGGVCQSGRAAGRPVKWADIYRYSPWRWGSRHAITKRTSWERRPLACPIAMKGTILLTPIGGLISIADNITRMLISRLLIAVAAITSLSTTVTNPTFEKTTDFNVMAWQDGKMACLRSSKPIGSSW